LAYNNFTGPVYLKMQQGAALALSGRDSGLFGKAGHLLFNSGEDFTRKIQQTAFYLWAP
jgi:hypothetical protein